MKHNFRDLIVWQKARILVKNIYELTRKFPADERFGLTSQLRRAVVSIVSNIAEGSGRNTDADFLRFLDMANGSACEVEAQLYLALDFDFITQEDLHKINIMVHEIQKLLFNFRQSIINKNKKVSSL